MKTLGEYFKTKREAGGLSLREAEKRSGVSHSYIGDMEKGVYHPSFDKVIKLIHAYQTTMDELLTETGLSPASVAPAKSVKVKKIQAEEQTEYQPRLQSDEERDVIDHVLKILRNEKNPYGKTILLNALRLVQMEPGGKEDQERVRKAG